MCPLLKRGFDEPTTATKRNCARIVENMSKLVDDPYEVEPFVPLLLPQLARAKEEVSDPEARNVCAKAHDQLAFTAKKPPVWKRIEREKVVATLTELAPKGATRRCSARSRERRSRTRCSTSRSSTSPSGTERAHRAPRRW